MDEQKAAGGVVRRPMVTGGSDPVGAFVATGRPFTAVGWWPVGEDRVLWLRHGYHDNPTMRDAVCAWTIANGLDPAKVSALDPFIVRGSQRLCESPTLTVVAIVDAGEEPLPGDEWLPLDANKHPRRVRRRVPLRVDPPPDLFVDVAAEVQRAAAGDPEFRAWVAERMGDAEPASGPETGPGSPLAGQDALTRVVGGAEPSGGLSGAGETGAEFGERLLAAAAAWHDGASWRGAIKAAAAREKAEVQVRALLQAHSATTQELAAQVAALLRRHGRDDLADDPLSPDGLRCAADLIAAGGLADGPSAVGGDAR